MAEMKKMLGTVLALTMGSLTLGAAATESCAQYYGSHSTPAAATAADEMTIGEMLAVQNPSSQEAPQMSAPQAQPVQGIPVTMTRYDVPAADYASNPPAYAAENAAYQQPANAQAIPASVRPSMHAIQQTAYGEAAAPEPQPLPEDVPAGEMPQLGTQGLIAFSETVSLPEGPFQQVTLIDPTRKTLCVYHISMTTGQIELKSARKVEWDLQLIFLNSQKPLPQDVQAILQQNRKRR